ncbi:5,10-methylenetetrahydrofolate reductase [Candidatus Hodgkinia cicadicola]|nr:5,10-methylenetetrahydrofolate reductase [Candidatus Hodgkinia cicadicola]
MYSGIQCLYNLSSADLKLSVEVFPPKTEQVFVGAIGEYLVASDNALPRFVSATCGAVGVAIPKSLAYLVQADKPFKTFQVTARSFALLGVSGLVFLRGDHCVSSQLRLDLTSGLRRAGRSSLFCTTTNYPETHNLSASARLGRACVCSLAQSFNFAEAFARLNVRPCLLSKLWGVPEFIACVRRLSSCRTSVKCGAHIHDFARCPILAGCLHAVTARAMFVHALAKLYSIVSNNICWLHVFVLNKFRTLRKLVWLLSISDINLMD